MVLTKSLFDDIKTEINDFTDVNFLYGAVGTAGDTPVVSGTGLNVEVFRTLRTSFDGESQTDTVIVPFELSNTEANGHTIRELGLFLKSQSTADGDKMWFHGLVNAINKTSDIQLFFDIILTYTVEEDTT